MGNGASVQERPGNGRRRNAQGSNGGSSDSGCGGSASPERSVCNNCHENFRPLTPSRSPARSVASPVSVGKVSPTGAVTAIVHGAQMQGEDDKEADQRGGYADLNGFNARQRVHTAVGSGIQAETSSCPRDFQPQARSSSSLTSGGFQVRFNEKSPRGSLNVETRSPQSSVIQKIFDSKFQPTVKPSSPYATSEDLSSPRWLSQAGSPGVHEREQSLKKRLGRVPNLNESGHSVKIEGSPSIVTPTYVSPTAQLYQNIMRDKGIPADSCSPKLFTFGLENALERERKGSSPEPRVLTQDRMDQMWEDINRSFASLQEQTDRSRQATPVSKHALRNSPVGSGKKPKTYGVPQAAMTPSKAKTLNLLINALEQVNLKITQKHRKEPLKARKCQEKIANLQEYILQKGALLDWDPNFDAFLISGVVGLLDMINANKRLLHSSSSTTATLDSERTDSGRRSPDGASKDSKDAAKPLIFVDPEVEHSDTSGCATEDHGPRRPSFLPDNDSFGDDQRPRDPKDIKIDKYLGVPLTENWVYAERVMDYRRQLVDMCAEVQRDGRSRRMVFGKQLYELMKLVSKMNRAGWTVGSFKNVEPVLRLIVDQARLCLNQYVEETSR